MSRIIVIIPSTATGDVKTLLDAVQAKLGVTPNFRCKTGVELSPEAIGHVFSRSVVCGVKMQAFRYRVESLRE